MNVPVGLLSWLAHEIATPLNSIRLLAEMLEANRSGALGEKELRYAASLQTAAGELNRLLDDLSLLGRLLDGRLEPRPAPVSPEEWVTALREAYRPAAREASVELQLEIAAGVPTLLHLDAALCERLLGPIMARAIAVSRGARVRLSLEGSVGGGVTLAVADSGAPLAPDERESLFEPFRRRDAPTGGGRETGLGLLIARELAGRLGGSLAVDSSPLGVRLSVSLPAATP
jgi:signal transduction histidine kinase